MISLGQYFEPHINTLFHVFFGGLSLKFRWISLIFILYQFLSAIPENRNIKTLIFNFPKDCLFIDLFEYLLGYFSLKYLIYRASLKEYKK